jgi:ribosome maturation factor RimP
LAAAILARLRLVSLLAAQSSGYNPAFQDEVIGRILPAHFFWPIEILSIDGSNEVGQGLMDWQTAVQGTVTGLGYELVDAQRSAGGLLRVFIDKALAAGAAAPAALQEPAEDRFITVEDCERVTRQLQHVLEVEGCDYQRLEVSSPGLDRPLKKPADFERFAGEQIELTLKLALKGRKKYRGELRAQAAGWRVVFGEGEPQQALDFLLEDVREARLVPVIDFKGRRFATPVQEPAAATGKQQAAVPGKQQPTVAGKQQPTVPAGGVRRVKGVQGERRQ